MRVLAVVLAVTLLAGCGGDDRKTADCSDGGDTHFATYQVRATVTQDVTEEAMEDTVRGLCERASRFGRDDVMITREGSDRIKVGSAKPLGPPLARNLGSSGRLQILDWEANLRPADQDSPTLSLFQSVDAAADQTPAAEPADVPPGGPSQAVVDRYGGNTDEIEEHYDRQNDATGDRYYLFGPGRAGARRPLGPGGAAVSPAANQATVYYASEADARAVKPPPGSSVARVPRGIALVKDQQVGAGSLGYWAVEDDTELSGADIRDPKQAVDPQTNEPIIRFEFSEDGREAFAHLTKRVAQRGANTRIAPGTDPQASLQRFAIALDGQLVSLAAIDPRANPEGLDGSGGAQINGVGSIDETRDLATLLALGPLPLDLTLVELR
jgi:preprotein translocase subunit SecD